MLLPFNQLCTLITQTPAPTGVLDVLTVFALDFQRAA